MLVDHVEVSSVKCHYGGFSYFGNCPCCRRRVRTLYPWKTIFACRCCLGMGYATQNQTLSFRLYLKMKKVKEKLKGDEWLKPKGMHQKTFERLHDLYFDLDEKYLIADFFSLRHIRMVDKVYKRYGSALTAAECWEMHFWNMDCIPQHLAKKLGYTWDFDNDLPTYAQ